jgi:hypothetical protein
LNEGKKSQGNKVKRIEHTLHYLQVRASTERQNGRHKISNSSVAGLFSDFRLHYYLQFYNKRLTFLYPAALRGHSACNTAQHLVLFSILQGVGVGRTIDSIMIDILWSHAIHALCITAI